MAGFKDIVELLDRAVGGPEAQVGVHGAFWRGTTRDEFVNSTVRGRRLLVPGDPEGSNLLDALRGVDDFDGSPFRRMPSGGLEPISETDLQTVREWIAAGCPDQDPVVPPTPPVEPPVEPGPPAPPSDPDPPAQPTGYVAHPILPSSLGGPRKVYRIHPGVGVARVGNSVDPEGWFLGPEVPGEDFVPEPEGRYRDADGNIRRQGARFRVFEYSYASPGSRRPPAVREITSDEAEITWHVHVANNKAFTRDPAIGDKVSLPNDPGGRSISGHGQHLDITGQLFSTPLTLGTLKTDEKGRLIVLGGHGAIDSSTGVTEDSLFWPDWCDDTADGPVRATVKLKNGEMPAVQPAWVLTGVPAFAAPLENIVTLYDVAHDVAVRTLGHPLPQYVSFTHDIYPILRRVVRMQWASASARQGHGPGRGGDFLEPSMLQALADNDRSPGSVPRNLREGVFSRITPPGEFFSGDMPALNFLTLTATQHETFRKWMLGDFLSDWTGEPNQRPFSELSGLEQTTALDRAHLAGANGGGFLPGVEASFEITNPGFWERPFRINSELAPGALTRGLSVPWQVDFSSCGWGWWPAARPNATTPDGETWQLWVQLSENKHLVEEWWKQAFLQNQNADGREIVVETERIAL